MGCSFAFTCTGGDRWLTADDGTAIREVTEIKSLDDISIVTRPAYLATNVQARRLEEEAARHRKPLTVAEARRRMAEQDRRLGLRLPTRSGYAAAATVSPERQALQELRDQRTRLERMARTDPTWRFNTEIANRREQRRRSDGAGMGHAIRGQDGRLWAPE